MYTKALLRSSAALGLLSGAFMALPAVVELVTGETALTSLLLGLSPALAVPLAAALHARQIHAVGAFGTVAHLVNLLGLGLFGGAAYSLNIALFHLDAAVLGELMGGPAGLVVLACGLVFALGSVLFGVSMVRARVHPRVPAWGHAVALPALAVAAPLPDSPLTIAVHVLAGASVAWLAAVLWARAEAPVPAVPAAA
ncbi:hypothetical protein [Nocardiopsis aegyptia]|uniref:Uncharacterized protein n=1 Tax=Nocardiopsis aegyptia TaxID=220378 RepID=A0A7Z0ERP2_9ACTN|nr:hypothetical protein [Nocardiopsis aegyptia]NYJ37061.1 hypothetical protein [Nocardiopsis aegyptia]